MLVVMYKTDILMTQNKRDHFLSEIAVSELLIFSSENNIQKYCTECVSCDAISTHHFPLINWVLRDDKHL